MSLNGLKKTVVFSSLEGKNLIDALLSDAANATGRTLSAALEYHLLHDSLLPQNETAAAWIIMLYRQEKSIGNVISDLAAYLAAVEKNRNVETFRAILQFCKMWGNDAAAVLDDEYSLSYLTTQVNCVTEFMTKVADAAQSSDIYLTTDLLREANRMELLVKDAAAQINDKAPVEIDALYFWEVFAAYPVIGRCERAYRLVAWLAKHCCWRDNAQARYSLVRLLKMVSRDWA